MAYSNAVRSREFGILDRLTVTKSTIAERIARYRTFRRTCTELDSLSDRELADLGVRRFDIRRLAYEAAHTS